jgi:hypothetical protein
MDPETRFSEEEVQRILARAARQQDHAESSVDHAQTGLSLTRLQEVAADVGISPAHVEAAAREVLLHRQTPTKATLAGLPRELRTLRAAPGRVSDAQWERMVAEFRRIFKKNGIPSQFGEVREWVSSNETGDSMPVVVRLEPDGTGGTRISIHQQVVSASALALGLGGGLSGVGLVFGGMVGIGLLESAAIGFSLFMFVTGAVSAGGGWLATRAWITHQQRALEKAADRAELVLRS